MDENRIRTFTDDQDIHWFNVDRSAAHTKIKSRVDDWKLRNVGECIVLVTLLLTERIKVL